MSSITDLSGPIRVLHVDDEPDLAALAADFLERHDDRLAVETATSGTEGLDRIRRERFDCIISDYDMPGMDGLDLLDAVREEYDLPFLLYTGKGSEEVAGEAIARGVTDYFQKESGTEQYELLANRILNAVQQHRATQQARNLSRIRSVLRDANQALVRARTRDEIESRVCEIISDSDPYLFAWTGEHDPDTRTVRPRTAAGVEAGYLDEIEVTTGEDATGQGPTGRAVRTRELAVMQNIPENDAFEPWRADALERGYQSSAAIPLVYDDALFGVLNVYADRTHAFDERERELLDELAGDIAHALSHAESRARQRRYERIIENLPVGVYRTTPGGDGRVVDANPALAEIFGADSPDEMIGREVAEFYEDPEERTALRRKLREDGIVQEVELRQETLSGDDGWMAVTTIRTADDDGVYFDGIIRDITERKERERQLRLFRNAVESSGHAIYFTDADGTIEYVNPAFEETSGYTAEEAIGENPRILRSGEHDAAFYEEMWQTILAGDTWRNELVNRSKSGARYVVDQTVAPVEDESGEVAHFIAVNADITEQKARERELDRNQSRWHALFENSPDAIAVHDAYGDIVEVNEQQVRSLGYSREELCSMNVTDFEVGRSREELRDLWTSLDPRERVKVRGEHRRADGSSFPVEIWATKIAFEGDERIIALGRDVSDREKSKRELERERERLEESIDVVSHDLQNPLNVLEGRLEFLRDECSTDHMDPAVRALDRCESLVEDLRVFAHVGDRIEALDSIDLPEIVVDCWKTVVTNDATLNVETERVIRADRGRLRHLLENLVQNAVEHGGSDVTVTIGDLEDGFYIEDDGPGIPADLRAQVFENGFSTADCGRGLGLAIASQVAEIHDWTVAVKERSGGGARFEITSVEFDGE